MKKSLLAATISVALVLSTGAALANPVTLDGSVSFQARHNTSTGNPDTNGNKTTFLLNANMQLSDSYSFFARGAIQGASSANAGPDFQSNVYSGNYAAAIDQFGIKYKQGNIDATVGRQATFIGSTGLLYDNTSYLGKRYMNDGVTLNIANGNTTYNFVVVQEDRDKYTDGTNKKIGDNKIYALHVDNKATDALTVGATLAKYDYQTNNAADPDLKKDPTYWAVNAGYALGKASLYTEYAKSSTDVKNKAYAYGVSYTADDKNSISVTNFKVEDNGDIGALTTFDNGYKGQYYVYNHNFDKSASLNFLYKDIKNISDNTKATSFRTTITYKF